MKKIIIAVSMLSFIVIMFSCKNETKNKKATIPSVQEELSDKKLPELSVYNLPSTWKNQANQSIKLEDLKGKAVVAVMIYTTCRASCPKLIQDMKNIHEKVSKKANQNTQYVFVSIDPKVDTPKRLKDFSEEKGLTAKEWMFLTGTEEDTQEFAAVLGVSYKKSSPIDYAHSNIITVFDKQGVVTFQKEGFGGNEEEIVNAIERVAE